MATDLLVAAPVILGLMAGWYAFQTWVRRSLPGVGRETDILEGRWGCRGCFLSNACEKEGECGRA